MIDSLIQRTLKLKEHNCRNSYFIAKELAMIELSLLWHDEKLQDNIARLMSLAKHVMESFPECTVAEELSDSIKNTAVKLGHKEK